MPTLYAPGATPVAVTTRGFAALEAGASAALLGRIRSLLADGRGLGGVIEALTGAYGASLTAIPGFAVALVESESVRVAVRGDFAFEVAAGAAERVSGAGVTTWTERVIPAVQRVTLTSSEPDAAPAEFEIADGIVLAGTIVWDAAPVRSVAAAAADAPAPVAAPAPIEAPAPTAAPAPADEPRLAADAPVAGRRDEPEGQDDPVEPSPDAEEEPAAPAPGPRRAAPPAVAAASGMLIDSSSVPSVADAETLLPFDSALHPVAVPPGAPDTAGAQPDDSDDAAGFDAEVGATVLRPLDEPGSPRDATAGIPGVPAPVPGIPAPVPGVPATVIGDHDGATISLAQARALRAGASEDAAGAASALPADSAPAPLAPPRPPAPGRVRLSTGQVVALDRTVVIGRRPRSTRVSGTDLPHLVAVDSPQQDISRSHVELRVEGESIVATDLRTTNGTTLLRSGADPVRLHPGEGTVVVPGDVLDLGDGVTVHIEAPS